MQRRKKKTYGLVVHPLTNKSKSKVVTVITQNNQTTGRKKQATEVGVRKVKEKSED